MADVESDSESPINKASKLEVLIKNAPGDFSGGLTSAIVALPIALAFGESSGLGAAAGLYGAIASGFFASLFGGTPAQVTGPTGPMTVVTAAMLATNPGKEHLIFASVIIAGFIQIILSKLKAGQLIHYIPYPVISGFMSGIGLIIITIELRPLLGHSSIGDILDSLQGLPDAGCHINWQATTIGLICLSSIYVIRKISPKAPAFLIALLLSIGVQHLLHYKIPDIGNLPAGLPHIILPNLEFNHINLVLFNAISLALLGSIDSLLTAVVVDKLTKTRHDSDRELLGQGLGNIFSGFFGGLPSAGATMRSLANVQSGGRSRLSGMTHSIILLFVLLGLGRYASQIPQTCLAAILISVGISIIDYKGLKLIHKAPREDVLVMIVVLLLTVFVDLIVAVAVGVTLACTLFAKKLSDTTLFTVGNLDSLEHLHEIYEHLPVDLRKKIYFYTFRGPIFFADVRNFTDSLENVSKAKYIIMRFAHVPIIDQTGAYALEEAINHWQEEDIKILYVGLPKHIMATIKDVGAMHNLDLDAQYETFEEAIEAIIAIEKQIE